MKQYEISVRAKITDMHAMHCNLHYMGLPNWDRFAVCKLILNDDRPAQRKVWAIGNKKRGYTIITNSPKMSVTYLVLGYVKSLEEINIEEIKDMCHKICVASMDNFIAHAETGVWNHPNSY